MKDRLISAPVLTLLEGKKGIVVADAISPVTMGSVFHLDEAKKELAREVHRLARLG